MVMKLAIALLSCLFLFLSEASIASERSLEYHIDPHVEQGCIKVSSRFETDEKGEITVQLPEYGELKGSFLEKDLTISIEEGYPLNRVIKASQPYSKVTLNYTLCHNSEGKHFEQPYFGDNEFFFTSVQALALPAHQQNSRELWSIQVKLQNVQYEKVYTSAGAHHDFTVHAALNDFFEYYFLEAEHSPQLIHQKPDVYMHVLGTQAPDKELLAANLRSIYHYYRTLMDEDLTSPFMFIMNFKNDLNIQIGRHPIQAVVMNAWEGTDFNKLMYATSHEYFHEWLGRKMTGVLPQGEFQWLFEGVTDYIGALMAYEHNLIDLPTYLFYVNKAIKRSHLNPFNTFSNAKLYENFYEDNLYGQLAMSRGLLMSLALEKNRSFLVNGENPTYAFVRRLYSNLKQNKTNIVDWKTIQKSFQEVFGTKAWFDYLKGIDGIQMSELPKTILNGKALLESIEVDIPVFGFDIKSVIVDKKVGRVDLNSAAFHAGLREGDSVMNAYLDLEDPQKKNSIIVWQENKWVDISFVPNQTKTVQLPQYTEHLNQESKV